MDPAAPAATPRAQETQREGPVKIDYTSPVTALVSAPFERTAAAWAAEGARQETLATAREYGPPARRLLDHAVIAFEIANLLDDSAYEPLVGLARVKTRLATKYSPAPACVDDLLGAEIWWRRAMALLGGENYMLNVAGDGRASKRIAAGLGLAETLVALADFFERGAAHYGVGPSSPLETDEFQLLRTAASLYEDVETLQIREFTGRRGDSLLHALEKLKARVRMGEDRSVLEAQVLSIADTILAWINVVSILNLRFVTYGEDPAVARALETRFHNVDILLSSISTGALKVERMVKLTVLELTRYPVTLVDTKSPHHRALAKARVSALIGLDRYEIAISVADVCLGNTTTLNGDPELFDEQKPLLANYHYNKAQRLVRDEHYQPALRPDEVRLIVIRMTLKCAYGYFTRFLIMRFPQESWSEYFGGCLEYADNARLLCLGWGYPIQGDECRKVDKAVPPPPGLVPNSNFETTRLHLDSLLLHLRISLSEFCSTKKHAAVDRVYKAWDGEVERAMRQLVISVGKVIGAASDSEADELAAGKAEIRRYVERIPEDTVWQILENEEAIWERVLAI